MFDDLKLDRPFIHCSSIDKYETLNTYDLVFTKGVLIHINPNQLESVYEKMYNLSNKYILIAEYYNPMPAEVIYRGMEGKLFKRDFAGEMIDKYKLKLVDFGFSYHRGEFPQDDLNWFLLSKE
jgi:spore coat polysaccharide biosynthesis protein SpsF